LTQSIGGYTKLMKQGQLLDRGESKHPFQRQHVDPASTFSATTAGKAAIP
jgi:hypothetical protein